MHGDRFVIGVVGGVAPLPTPRIPGAKTTPIPSNVCLVAPVLEMLLGEVIPAKEGVRYLVCIGFSNFSSMQKPHVIRELYATPLKLTAFLGSSRKE